MSSSNSTIAYTCISSEDVPFWGAAVTSFISPTAESPGYVAESDPEEDPEEYEDDEPEDGSVNYPIDEGDDGDDNDSDSSGDDADDEDEDDEEEEHLASADSTVVVPTVELVSPPEGTELVIPPPSTDITTTRARIIVWLQASISLPPKAEAERLLAMPTPPPSPITSLSPPSARERLARCTAPSAHSSLPPVPLPLLPSSGCRTQIQTLRITSTQALIDAVTIDSMHQEHMVEILRVIGDMRREMGDTQAELLALREQRRRVRQPGSDARVPDHQDASTDADSYI
nr:hypothetical protein [Tanacetum cinerariifolium]